jgi:hypothetical protein
MATVEARRVSKHFGEVRAVDGIDLTARAGRLYHKKIKDLGPHLRLFAPPARRRGSLVGACPSALFTVRIDEASIPVDERASRHSSATTWRRSCALWRMKVSSLPLRTDRARG